MSIFFVEPRVDPAAAETCFYTLSYLVCEKDPKFQIIAAINFWNCNICILHKLLYFWLTKLLFCWNPPCCWNACCWNPTCCWNAAFLVVQMKPGRQSCCLGSHCSPSADSSVAQNLLVLKKTQLTRWNQQLHLNICGYKPTVLDILGSIFAIEPATSDSKNSSNFDT